MTKEFYYPISGKEIEDLIIYAKEMTKAHSNDQFYKWEESAHKIDHLKDKIKERNVVDIEGFNDRQIHNNV